ncbi:hypothetical protein HYH03_016287 [Edaphochlamys debaryana]|uniref:PIH1 N-terminal domain-containing protein n=1 Tax=Edaphochlamys debaryana TaxID=47281 RepID=A0A836BQ09_9CHLO|nr:hypothetical protein HYH03_016287 [Edaphochlamys debaryana]|eukprot:KAG2484901.1 hypothetical protein HYH03_016287 [Edaphochlamys debaryana]
MLGGDPAAGLAGDEQPPSPEELMALLEMMQQSGMDMSQVPPDLKTMLDNVKRQKGAKGGKGKGGVGADDVPTEEITPKPGFVIKTYEKPSGYKVFINVCSSDRVAAPGGWTNGLMPEEVAAALEKLQTSDGPDASAAALAPSEVEALRFPLACGPPRVDADRKGATATSIDVVFNEDILRAAQAARRLKVFVIEMCLGWVAKKLGAELDPRYKLPKMRYKGEVVATQRIRADDKRKALVTVLPQVEEEPSFALRTKKAPAPPPVGPAAPTTSTAATSATAPAASGTAGSAPPAAAAGAGPGPSSFAFGAAGGKAGAAAGSPAPRVKVEYEGRPVEWIRVTVDLDLDPGRAGSGPGSCGVPEGLTVEVAGRSVFVRPGLGRAEVVVPLQFAASAEGSTAACEPLPGGTAGVRLVVRLPYRSLDEHLADARAQAPLAFGQLGLASSSLLELEP